MSRYAIETLDGHAAARHAGLLHSPGDQRNADLYDLSTAEWWRMDAEGRSARKVWRPREKATEACERAWTWSTGIPRMRVVDLADGSVVWDSQDGAPAHRLVPAKVEVCAACRRGEHADHHDGVWRRADGTDPVVCPCKHEAAAEQMSLPI